MSGKNYPYIEVEQKPDCSIVIKLVINENSILKLPYEGAMLFYQELVLLQKGMRFIIGLANGENTVTFCKEIGSVIMNDGRSDQHISSETLQNMIDRLENALQSMIPRTCAYSDKGHLC